MAEMLVIDEVTGEHKVIKGVTTFMMGDRSVVIRCENEKPTRYFRSSMENGEKSFLITGTLKRRWDND